MYYSNFLQYKSIWIVWILFPEWSILLRWKWDKYIFKPNFLYVSFIKIGFTWMKRLYEELPSSWYKHKINGYKSCHQYIQLILHIKFLKSILVLFKLFPLVSKQFLFRWNIHQTRCTKIFLEALFLYILRIHTLLTDLLHNYNRAEITLLKYS